MNCYTHATRSAVGMCAVCQKAVCHDCVGQDAPRLVCRSCAARGAAAYGRVFGYGGYGYGFDYKSSISIGGGAFGPSVISGMRCDETAREFFRQWIAALPPACR